MLALRDPSTGHLVPAPTTGALRMCVRGPAHGRQAGPEELRRLLVADLVPRVIEDLNSTQVLLIMVRSRPDDPASGLEAPDGLTRGLNHDLDALWLRPFAGVTNSVACAEEWLGGRAHLLVDGDRRRSQDRAASPDPMRLRVGATSGGPMFARPWRDPVATRLALLEQPYARPGSLTLEQLDAASATLVRWRDLVRCWADQPAAPMCRAVVDRVTAALDNDLDVRAALDALRALEEEPSVAPGAKLDTFLYLDRTLGLDLVRHLAGGG